MRTEGLTPGPDQNSHDDAECADEEEAAADQRDAATSPQAKWDKGQAGRKRYEDQGDLEAAEAVTCATGPERHEDREPHRHSGQATR